MSANNNETTTTTLVPASTTTTTTTTTATLQDAMKTVEVIKERINQYDITSSKYKAVLRNMTAESSNSATTAASINDNSVSIEWIKVDSGTISEAPTKLILQLSSPVEEATLCLVPPKNAATTTLNKTNFRGVETNQATLAITAHWDSSNTAKSTKNVVAGVVSETTYMDVSKFTHELLDVLQEQVSTSTKSYETTLRIPILKSETQTTTTEAEKVASVKNNTNTQPLCTVTIQVQYKPSRKDVREELCECIGKIATQKAIAREELRKVSLYVHELSNTGESTNPKPTAMKSGFLQKDKSTSTSTSSDDGTTPTTSTSTNIQKWYQAWFERTVTTTTSFIFPICKNYVYFVAFTIVAHYYGHQLSIPAPV